MYWLYKPSISLYFHSIRIAALFRADAKKWVAGRMGWKEQLNSFIASIPHRGAQRIWIHVSSLGEFEQGRELIELIRKNHPEKMLILSFFSPSGFDKCKNYNSVDYVCYFPSDSYQIIESFIQTLAPSLAIFVKYDFWFNTLELLKKNKIPYCFISTILRKNHFLFQPLFRSLLTKLKSANQIFLQNESSYLYLKKAGFNNIQVSGDTRLDRVYRLTEENTIIPGLEYFCDRPNIFIAGSIWESDLVMITDSIHRAILHQWKIILVPHVTDESTIRILEKVFHGQTVRYSKLSKISVKPILIIDQIGLLSRLYKVCVFAYVGGGFGKGIHNILEPAGHKKAVCFGPHYHKFQEAKDFINQGIGYEIRNGEDLDDLFKELPDKQDQTRFAIDDYFKKNLGSSQKIYQYLIDEKLIKSPEGTIHI